MEESNGNRGQSEKESNDGLDSPNLNTSKAVSTKYPIQESGEDRPRSSNSDFSSNSEKLHAETYGAKGIQEEHSASDHNNTRPTHEVSGHRTGGRDVAEKLMCKHCRKKEAKMLFVPCGHCITCQNCSMQFQVCFICYRDIERCLQVIRV